MGKSEITNSSFDPSGFFANKASIEQVLHQRIHDADAVKTSINQAQYNRDEWIFRLNISAGLLGQSPQNETLGFLAEQAQLNLDMAQKKLDLLIEQDTLAQQTKTAAIESLKKLQRLEVLRASGNAARGSRDEIREIMTRTAQLELSDNSTDRETRRAEYYVQAMLELSMEGN